MAERRAFAGLGGWLWSLYNRVLMRRPRMKLPWRGAVKRVRLRGQERPFYLRLGTSDWLVLQEVFVDGEYAALGELDPRAIRTIVDLGANVGFSVRLWQEKFPQARIIAVEPDAGNMDLCRRNAGAHPAPGAAPHFESCCVGGVRRKVSLDHHPMGEWAFRMAEVHEGTEVFDAITMPDLLDRSGVTGSIDFLKCDIEGAEREVFAHASEWISRVENMVVELHAPYSLEQFEADLRSADARPWMCRVVNRGKLELVVLARRADGK